MQKTFQSSSFTYTHIYTIQVTLMAVEFSGSASNPLTGPSPMYTSGKNHFYKMNGDVGMAGW